MIKLLMTLLLFGVPEDPNYTSQVCIRSWSDYPDASAYEIAIGTSSEVYDRVIPTTQGTLSAITCEDMQIIREQIDITYYTKVIVVLSDGTKLENAYSELSSTMVAIPAIVEPVPPTLNAQFRNWILGFIY